MGLETDNSPCCNGSVLRPTPPIHITTRIVSTQVKKPFRKNGMNVGMASTSIGRKEVSFIYVDHTINSARGQDEEDVGWWPRAEFMV